MTTETIIILTIIGLFAGVVSGFVGVGGGIIVVPALVYFLGITQHEAQGTSLLLMLPPIGILAVMNYHKAGQLNYGYGLVIATTFIIGAYFGSKYSLKLSSGMVKLIFGLVMIYVSFKMIVSGYNSLSND